MGELTSVLRKFRFSLIPMLLSQVTLILGELSEAQFGFNLKTYSIVSSVALALISLALILRGLSGICEILGGKFCVLKRLMKYLLPASMFLTMLGIVYSYDESKGFEFGFAEIASRPVLLISALLFIFLVVTASFSLLRIGSLTDSMPLKLGSPLLALSPVTVVAGYPAYGSAIGIAGTLIIVLGLTRLIRAGVELIEEVTEAPEEYEEVEETPPKPGKIFEESEKEFEEAKIFKRELKTPVSQVEKKAKLMGPNGLEIELGFGLRAFGRRDFVGYVPEEDLAYISRRHFEVRGSREGFFIRDLGSLNGTWVNGNKLERGDLVKLTNGSVIDVAEVVRLKFSIEGEDLGVPEL